MICLPPLHWSQALGLKTVSPDDGGLGIYDKFEEGPGGLYVEVQKVSHPSRVHLDIEAADIAISSEMVRMIIAGSQATAAQG